MTNTSGKDERKQRLEADRERREQLRQQAPPAFKSVYGQLMAASTLGGGLSPGQEAALRDLDGIMATAEHVIRGVPVGAGAHSTICALLMDAYAKGQQSCRSASA